MSICKACYTIPPVTSNYEPSGTTFKINDDFEVYSVGDKESENVVIIVYDIFGFHNVTKKFADHLAESGKYLVVMPDFFRGKPWDMKNGMENLKQWIQENGTYDVCKPIVETTIQHLEQTKQRRFAMVGFCWGAAVCVWYQQHSEQVLGSTLLHPSLIQLGGSADDASKLKSPVLVITTKDDPSYDVFVENAKKKPFGPLCAHHHFADVHHGFAAARGDWSNPVVAQRVREALQLCIQFFNKQFKQ